MKKALCAAAVSLTLAWGGAALVGASAQTVAPAGDKAGGEKTSTSKTPAKAPAAAKTGAEKTGAETTSAEKTGASKTATAKATPGTPTPGKAAPTKTASAKTTEKKPPAKKPATKKATGEKGPAADPAADPSAGKATAEAAATEEAAAHEETSQGNVEAFIQALDEVDPKQTVSDTVVDLAAWVIATGDNRELPFAVVDKGAAQILVFGADGKLRGLAPALVGSAVGDESAPGVGDRELKDIPLEERTTPAGRFLAAFGPAMGGKRVLWVDYATAISIHPLESTRATKKEKRKERLASATPEDNRITHGCINVSPAFYSKIVRPAFKNSGVFYILPDTASLETAFPAFLLPERFLAERPAEKRAAYAVANSEPEQQADAKPPAKARKQVGSKPSAKKDRSKDLEGG